MQLNQVGDEIWTYDGCEVDFYGFTFPTRMTVVRLRGVDLWVHSPEKLSQELKQELAAFGTVRYLISPNKLHHLFLGQWIEAYPKARKYSAPGLARKRQDIKFDAELSEYSDGEWSQEIEQTIFRGSPAMEEVVFYHKLSRTLILTDLIENFDPDTLDWWQRGLARLAGILSPNGKMPLDWRLTFRVGSMERARASFRRISGWNVENVILSHGKCVFGCGGEFVRKSFSWLIRDA
ncbi:MAG: DUF4336 domain-containing protein [Halochromatium sp.]